MIYKQTYSWSFNLIVKVKPMLDKYLGLCLGYQYWYQDPTRLVWKI